MCPRELFGGLSPRLARLCSSRHRQPRPSSPACMITNLPLRSRAHSTLHTHANQTIMHITNLPPGSMLPLEHAHVLCMCCSSSAKTVVKRGLPYPTRKAHDLTQRPSDSDVRWSVGLRSTLLMRTTTYPLKPRYLAPPRAPLPITPP